MDLKKASGIGYQASGIRHQASGIRGVAIGIQRLLFFGPWGLGLGPWSAENYKLRSLIYKKAAESSDFWLPASTRTS
jgi:hypothetical protein